MATAEATALTKAESTRLAKCEQTIETGLSSFIDVGNALAEIRDDKLHKATHSTFVEYIRDRWHMEKSHAYRLIDAASVVETSPMGDKITNERIARELKDVPPKQHRAVLKAASEDGAPTAASVRDAISTLPAMGSKNGHAGKPEKPPKSGKERVSPESRKDAQAAFGKLVRALDRMGISESLDKELAAILRAIKSAK